MWNSITQCPAPRLSCRSTMQEREGCLFFESPALNKYPIYTFGIACSTPPALKMKKRILDKIPGIVELFVVAAQYVTTFPWWRTTLR